MKMFEEISFNNSPIMFAAWPGMGNVGLIAVDYLRRKLGAKLFAEIDMSQFFIPDSIVVKEGIAQLPDMPSSVFHYVQNPDLLIFESNAQISGKDGIAIIKTILDIAKEFRVARVYTAAAFAQPMSHSNSSEILCACNDQGLLNVLTEFDVVAMPDGYIAGLNGLMLGVAKSRDIEAACFLGTIPSYATNISYPKASLQIVRTMARLLNTDIDCTELEAGVNTTDQQLAAIEDRIREYFPSVIEGKQVEIPNMESEEVPKYIMDRIEQLFDKVKQDKSVASELKDELVRWNLYDLYEHRFLDLFKDDDTRQ